MARSACRRIPQLHRIGRLRLGDRRFRYRRHQRRRCEIARRLRLRLDFQSERQRIFLLPRSGALRRLLRHADGQHERLVGFLLGQRTLPRRHVPGRGLLGALVPDQGHGRQRDDYHLARRRRCPAPTPTRCAASANKAFGCIYNGIGSRMSAPIPVCRGELPVGNEQTRGLRAVEVFALEDMDEEDEHRQQQRAEDNAHEPEKRQADEHAENRHERMRVGHSLL